MRNDQASFIVIDGIAGSGKSTIINAIKTELASRNLRIFDLAQWTREHAEPPHFKDIDDYDAYFTFEPTKYWVGAAIRYELSFQEPSGHVVAQAFSLDRYIQYHRLIVPALQAGKILIQDRSVSSSIVYQPIMKHAPTLDELLVLPGNALAMEYLPDHLLLTHIQPEKLVERLETREDDSKGIFQNIDYLSQVNDRFLSSWFSELFTKNGTSVSHVSTEIPKEQMINHTKQIISNMLATSV